MFEWSSSDVIFLPIALAIIIVITVILHFTMQDRSKNIRKIPLHIITGLILVLEIAKQVYYIVVGYNYQAIPLHFCSLFLYAFPLMMWTKGKFQLTGNALALVSTSMLLICFYLSPGNILGATSTANFFNDFVSFQTVTYHHLALLYLFVGLGLDLFDFDIANIVYFWCGFAFYSIIVVIVANIVHTEFISLLEDMITILKELRVKFGMAIYSVVTFLLGAGVGGLIFIIERAINLGIKEKR